MENNPYINSLEPVWQESKFVFVDEKRLAEVAKEMAQKNLKIPSWRMPYVQPESDDIWMDYVIMVNSINFCYRNFTAPKEKYALEYPEGEKHQGAFALGAAVMRAYNEGLPIFNADFLESMDRNTLENIFRSDIPLPLVNERLWVLNEVGKVLNHRFGGKFTNIFKEADGRCFNKGKGLVELLVNNFPSYCDRSYWWPTRTWLEFHKRAQLAAIVYQGRALSSEDRLLLLKDYMDLGPIADYEIPKVLHYLGILKYEKSLEERIREQKVIPANSREEIELRAFMSYVMKGLVEMLDKSILEVDFAAWSMARDCPDNHHLTPTIYY